jgi:hypothetical protein
MPAPVQDFSYVATLLRPLKRLAYEYLALEVNEQSPPETHSNDLVRFCRSYKKGEHVNGDQFPHAKPGWIELARQAIDLGYAIRFIDVPLGCDLFISYFIWDADRCVEYLSEKPQ